MNDLSSVIASGRAATIITPRGGGAFSNYDPFTVLEFLQKRIAEGKRKYLNRDDVRDILFRLGFKLFRCCKGGSIICTFKDTPGTGLEPGRAGGPIIALHAELNTRLDGTCKEGWKTQGLGANLQAMALIEAAAILAHSRHYWEGVLVCVFQRDYGEMEDLASTLRDTDRYLAFENPRDPNRLPDVVFGLRLAPICNESILLGSGSTVRGWQYSIRIEPNTKLHDTKRDVGDFAITEYILSKLRTSLNNFEMTTPEAVHFGIKTRRIADKTGYYSARRIAILTIFIDLFEVRPGKNLPKYLYDKTKEFAETACRLNHWLYRVSDMVELPATSNDEKPVNWLRQPFEEHFGIDQVFRDTLPPQLKEFDGTGAFASACKAPLYASLRTGWYDGQVHGELNVDQDPEKILKAASDAYVLAALSAFHNKDLWASELEWSKAKKLSPVGPAPKPNLETAVRAVLTRMWSIPKSVLKTIQNSPEEDVGKVLEKIFGENIPDRNKFSKLQAYQDHFRAILKLASNKEPELKFHLDTMTENAPMSAIRGSGKLSRNTALQNSLAGARTATKTNLETAVKTAVHENHTRESIPKADPVLIKNSSDEVVAKLRVKKDSVESAVEAKVLEQDFPGLVLLADRISTFLRPEPKLGTSKELEIQTPPEVMTNVTTKIKTALTSPVEIILDLTLNYVEHFHPEAGYRSENLLDAIELDIRDCFIDYSVNETTKARRDLILNTLADTMPGHTLGVVLQTGPACTNHKLFRGSFPRERREKILTIALRNFEKGDDVDLHIEIDSGTHLSITLEILPDRGGKATPGGTAVMCEDCRRKHP